MKLRLRGLFTCVIQLGFLTFAQAQLTGPHPRELALGRSGLALVDSLTPAPSIASKPFSSGSSVSIIYTRPFGIPELQQETVSFNRPIRGSSYLLSVSHFGWETFNETSIGIGFAKLFDPSIHRSAAIGVRIEAARMSIGGISNEISFAAEAGWIFRPTYSFAIAGKVVSNLSKRATRFRTPVSRMEMGIAYRPSRWLLVVTDVDKRPGNEPGIAVGMEAALSKSFHWRLGWNSQPGEWATGVGIVSGRMQIDFSGAYHGWLGWTSQVGTHWTW